MGFRKAYMNEDLNGKPLTSSNLLESQLMADGAFQKVNFDAYQKKGHDDLSTSIEEEIGKLQLNTSNVGLNLKKNNLQLLYYK